LLTKAGAVFSASTKPSKRPEVFSFLTELRSVATKAALSFAKQNQVSLSAKPEGAELRPTVLLAQQPKLRFGSASAN